MIIDSLTREFEALNGPNADLLFDAARYATHDRIKIPVTLRLVPKAPGTEPFMAELSFVNAPTWLGSSDRFLSFEGRTSDYELRVTTYNIVTRSGDALVRPIERKPSWRA